MVNTFQKPIFICIITAVIAYACSNNKEKQVDQTDRTELVPEPDQALREKYEKISKIKCALPEPDTALAGINIDDVESTLRILGKQTKLETDSVHIFYSNDGTQAIELAVHPGSNLNEVSAFSVFYTGNVAKENVRQLDLKEFQTGKGIKLGMSRKEIVEKLGDCYAALDSTENHIELYYRIALPNDSKTSLLKRKNMPVYFAAYSLNNDRLEYFEFGFENR